MSWLDLPYEDEPEQIDELGHSDEDLARSMADVAWSNRLFGGTQTILHHVARLLKDVPPGTPIRALDIATGSGDIPRALLAWADRRGLPLTIVAVDNHPGMLKIAQESPLALSSGGAGEEGRGASPAPPELGAEGFSGLRLVQADALALPFGPQSFDLAFCALAFHHFGSDRAARVLATMDQLTTCGLIVTDLRRDRAALWGVQAAMALKRAHPFTRHDAPASVRRAFTPREYEKIVALSGAQNVRISASWYFRIALVQQKREKVRQSG